VKQAKSENPDFFTHFGDWVDGKIEGFGVFRNWGKFIFLGQHVQNLFCGKGQLTYKAALFTLATLKKINLMASAFSSGFPAKNTKANGKKTKNTGKEHKH
jgi:hypothetical protein